MQFKNPIETNSCTLRDTNIMLTGIVQFLKKARPAKTYLNQLVLLSGLMAVAGCDYISSINTTENLIITNAAFDSKEGFELPYTIFAPNSIQDWTLSAETKLHYNKEKSIYVSNEISAVAPQVDESGLRFKICGENWSNQFGFSDHVPSEETIFGVTSSGTILSIQKVPFAASDMHMELSEEDLSASANKKIRIELKITDNSENPKALLRVSLY